MGQWVGGVERAERDSGCERLEEALTFALWARKRAYIDARVGTQARHQLDKAKTHHKERESERERVE